MAAFITLDELKSFHFIDRELYTRLVITLKRDPGQSMQVIALWLWLEEMGFPNIILKMLSLSDTVVKSLADEAVVCLNCLESILPPPPSITDIPLTLSHMKQNISLQFFHENRIRALSGITKIVNDVCAKAFEDIFRRALANAAPVMVPQGRIRPVGQGVGQMVQPIEEGTSVHRIAGEMMTVATTVLPPSVRPRFTHPHVHHPVSGEMGESSSHSTLNPKAQPWNPNDDVPQDERTMFITFSRGYPMGETEVQDFFLRTYGDCIESIHMQEVPPNTQPLYARLVFRSASTIARILDGKEKAKFVINGKHIWARLYKAKRPSPAAAAV